MKFIATTSPGLEKLLAEELVELGAPEPELSPGALSFEGDFSLAARVLLESRIASRLLLSLKTFSAKNAAMLYDQVRRIDWTLYLTTERTFSVTVHGNTEASDMRQSFAPLKIKDAICDELVKRGVERPNVDRANPELRIEAFFNNGRCEISIDLAGIPLHRRGYRSGELEAPLRENRAAALLRFAGYKGESDLQDPFCGGGTIAIEAALIAQKKAPGLLRAIASYAGYRALPELAERMAKRRDELKQLVVKNSSVKIVGSDLQEAPLKEARTHANTAGVQGITEFCRADAREFLREGAFVVSNPPYGYRLGDQKEAADILANFTRQLKHKCPKSTLTLILPQGDLEKAVGFRSSKKLSLENGPLSARFVQYKIF